MGDDGVIEPSAEIKIGNIGRGSILCCNEKQMAGSKQVGIRWVAEGTMDGSLDDMQLPVWDDDRFAIVLGQPGKVTYTSLRCGDVRQINLQLVKRTLGGI